MTEPQRRQIIYPARRAIEHAVGVQGARPLRLFAVLWPMWRAETTAQVYDEQSYEMIDLMLMRTAAEGGFSSPSQVAAFLGLPDSLVERCLAFLKVIGHIDLAGDVVTITPLGKRSVAEGIRYVLKEGRQPVFFEQFTGRPLPRRYYSHSVGFLDTPEIHSDQAGDGSRFWPLFVASRFEPSLVTNLEKRPDRYDLNLPRQLRDLQFLSERTVFLPVYLIETTNGSVLAYSGVSEGRDTFLENAISQAPTIRHLMLAEPLEDPRALWTKYLADGNMRGTLSQLPNGVWRGNSRSWNIR